MLLKDDCLIRVTAFPLVIKLSDHVSIANTYVNISHHTLDNYIIWAFISVNLAQRLDFPDQADCPVHAAAGVVGCVHVWSR